MNGTLYVIATPIGNLEDMTPRAIRVLQESDLIAAEDTRNTLILLNRFKIQTPLVSNHKFNEQKKVCFLIDELQKGKTISIVSDAGTPCISDPGYVLVKEAAAAGVSVVGICGACAATTAISVCGFRAESFLFFGFIPREKKHLDALLQRAIDSHTQVLVFYESPKRIKDTIYYFKQMIPDVSVCLCNDLTKKFEAIYRGSPSQIYESLLQNPSSEKGEYTIVLQLNPELFLTADEPCLSLEALLVDTMIKQNLTAKDAVKYLSRQKGQNRSELYEASLRLKNLWQSPK